jgi:uncharacterized RDD family membrane protein YckC
MSVLGVFVRLMQMTWGPYLAMATGAVLDLLKDVIDHASLGKRLMGLEVVDAETGLDASPSQKVIRNLMAPFMLGIISSAGTLPAMFGFVLGVTNDIWAFVTPTTQTLGDYMAGTIVRKVPKVAAVNQ